MGCLGRLLLAGGQGPELNWNNVRISLLRSLGIMARGSSCNEYLVSLNHL